MAISSPGIGSNLDINSIVSGLMQVEAQPLTALATKEASYQAQLTAYGSIKGALSSFQSSVRGLTDPTKFQTLKASASDAAVATVSASSTAAAGTYSIDVSKVAQSQKLVAAGQLSTTAPIGSGASTTLTFDFGSISGGSLTAYDSQAGTGGTYAGSTFTSNGSGVKTVTIDASNNSLIGIRDTINAAKIGVTASIINDGGATPYRLVFSSDTAGVSNSLKISASGGDAAITSLLTTDPEGTQNLQQTVASQNTELTVNGVFVSKASQSLTEVIQGVTLTALKVGTTSVTVARDNTATTTAVSAFVKSYNELNKTLKDLSAYDAGTKKAATLQGDSAVRSIQSQLRGLLGQGLTSSGAYSNLSQVGLTFQLDGSLELDSSKLQSALNANASSVAALFARSGIPTDSLVNYAGSTSATRPGNYALNVSQLATQGNLQGSAVAGLTVSAGVNDVLQVTLNGRTASITLNAQTYASAAELAIEIQSKINGATTFSSAGSSVAVTESGGVLSIASNRYGSDSAVTVSGIGANNALGSARVSNAGLDVAGTLGGIAGTGAGQNLTGASGSVTEGLKLLISGGITGSRGTVSFSQGYAYQLDKLVDSFLSSTGVLTSRTDGVSSSIKDIETRREVLNRRLANIEERYRKQFSTLDALISRMNQTSSYLTQQLASLQSLNSR